MNRRKATASTYYFFLIAIVIALAVFLGFKPSAEEQFIEKSKDIISNTAEEAIFSKHKLYLERLNNRNLAVQAVNVTSKVKTNDIANQASKDDAQASASKAITVNVWLKDENIIETVPLEDYVLYVTLHEIPWSFHDEAIKAQMIAARTYIIHKLSTGADKHKEYDVTDTTMHQVYRSIDEASLTEKEKEQLGHFKRLLEETRGKIITYENEAIDALYFSTSNGKTESAQHYFNKPLPYLQSVNSKWDKHISPSYTKQFEFSFEQFFTLLKAANVLEKESNSISIETIERSTSNRLVTLNINKQEISARRLREALGLASTDFTWTIDNKDKMISFTTTGYGHGVGLSQWGAEGMAREGYNAVEILQHFYTNIEIKSL